MDLVNEFTVRAPIDEAWDVLTDLERIAPCLPGAQLTEVEGEMYRGFVKIKVGPITAQFKGQAQFVEKDRANYKGTIKGDGRDTGGKGNASALIHAQLVSIDANTTTCRITTELTITGKVAQFGRGALADVSGKLIDQFAHNLETTVLADQAAHHPAPAESTVPAESAVVDSAAATEAPAVEAPAIVTPTPERATVRKIDHDPDVAPVDLLGTAGAPIAKRLLPVGLLAIIVFLLLRRRHHEA
jgi:carbon monoxide dehydrogenase subunit G